MVDLEKIKQRTTDIKTNIAKIRKYASLPDQQFWEDERNILSVKHLLLESIEACGAIGVHILARKLFKAPSSFADCFENLHQAGAIDEDLSARLGNMSRFRNILIQRYWDIQNEKNPR